MGLVGGRVAHLLAQAVGQQVAQAHLAEEVFAVSTVAHEAPAGAQQTQPQLIPGQVGLAGQQLPEGVGHPRYAGKNLVNLGHGSIHGCLIVGVHRLYDRVDLVGNGVKLGEAAADQSQAG